MKGGLHKCEMTEHFSDKDVFLLSDKLEKEKARASYWKGMYEWKSSEYNRLGDSLDEEQGFRIQNLKERDKWKMLAELFLLGLMAICCVFIFYALTYH